MKVKFDFDELYEFWEELHDSKNFDKYAKLIIREVAKDVIDVIKDFTPIGDTGVLVAGWDKRKIRVIKKGNGYEVQLVNDVPYATPVNDGHMAYNQYGGPYPIKQENRKLQTPYAPYQEPSEWFVYGHFFVERGLLHYENYGDVEDTVIRELEKWWDEL